MTTLDNTEVRSRTLTALFDTQESANQAVEDLVKAGIPREHIRLNGGTSSSSTTTSHDGEGFWESLKDLFVPEEDRYSYSEGIRRGGFLVVVQAEEANYTRVLDILDRDGSVDLEQREASWRSEGWTGYQSGQATGATALAGARAGSVSTSDTTTTRSAAATAATGSVATGGEEVVPVYEEQLNIGKRDVSHGRVRLRSYVVETPVTEQVNLRSESVQIDRRPVNRPVEAGDVAFKDRVIEAEERVEEAVVSKSARVTEEISLRKTADTETHTVSDSVRKTEVEIEDDRTGHGLATTKEESVSGGAINRKI